MEEARSLSASELEALTEVYLEEVHQESFLLAIDAARDLASPYLVAAFER